MYYILDENNNPQRCDDIITWTNWMAKHRSQLQIKTNINNILISTVFLGIDHGFGGKVMLWETMTFQNGNWNEIDCQRYSTIKEAQIGHEAIVTRMRKILKLLSN